MEEGPDLRIFSGAKRSACLGIELDLEVKCPGAV